MNEKISGYFYQIPQEQFQFDLDKIQQTSKVYHENHPGLTLVVGHPFKDQEFLEKVLEEQKNIANIFQKHGLRDFLRLYEAKQIHAIIIELASQHNESITDQKNLSEYELTHNKKGEEIQINFLAKWINKTSAFEVEFRPEVLCEEHKDQTIFITANGQIVMKGRVKENFALARMRSEFEDYAHITNKYGHKDDEFYFVIGYLTPSETLNEPNFLQDFLFHLQERRSTIRLSTKVSTVSAIFYQQRTLTPLKCIKPVIVT